MKQAIVLFIVVLSSIAGGWIGHRAGWESGQRQATASLSRVDPAAASSPSVEVDSDSGSPSVPGESRLARMTTAELSDDVRVAASTEDKEAWHTALDRLAKVEPQVAWQLVSEVDFPNEDARYGYLIVLESWIKLNPAEAWEALRALPDEHQLELSEALSEPLREWAKQDLDGAFAAWEELPESMRRQTFSGIGRLAADASIRPSLLEKLRQISDEALRLSAYTGTARAWAFHDSLEDVGDWLDGEQSLSRGQRAQIERQAAYSAVIHRPEQAVDWLLARSNPERRSADLEILVKQWGACSPNACGEWLGNLAFGTDTDAAVSTFAQRVVHDDPESAVSWAQRIVEKDRRMHTLIQVMSQWKMRAPSAARTFYESDALSDLEKSTLRRFMR